MSEASDDEIRQYLRRLVDWYEADCDPIDRRVADWTREWIASTPVEELRSWSIARGIHRSGLCFGRYNDTRDDTVYISSTEIAYHLMTVDQRDDPRDCGVWLVVAIDPPHSIIEYEPSRKDGEP